MCDRGGCMPAQGASQVVLVVKNLPAHAGDIRDLGSVPGLGRSLGEGNGKPLQYSCLENPMDRGAWQAIAYRVAKSQTRLKQLSKQAHMPGQAYNLHMFSPLNELYYFHVFF